MKRKTEGLAWLFAVVMLAFSLGLAALTVMRAQVDFALEDTARSLETSRGRERKQQHEYDEVTAQLPLTRAELEAVRPLADQAAERVRQLKETRKALREEKKALETTGTEKETVNRQAPEASETEKEEDAEEKPSEASVTEKQEAVKEGIPEATGTENGEGASIEQNP